MPQHNTFRLSISACMGALLLASQPAPAAPPELAPSNVSYDVQITWITMSLGEERSVPSFKISFVLFVEPVADQPNAIAVHTGNVEITTPKINSAIPPEQLNQLKTHFEQLKFVLPLVDAPDAAKPARRGDEYQRALTHMLKPQLPKQEVKAGDVFPVDHTPREGALTEISTTQEWTRGQLEAIFPLWKVVGGPNPDAVAPPLPPARPIAPVPSPSIYKWVYSVSSKHDLQTLISYHDPEAKRVIRALYHGWTRAGDMEISKTYTLEQRR